MLFVYMNVSHLGFPMQSFQLSTLLIGRAKGIKGIRLLQTTRPANDRPAACGWCSSSSPLPAIKFGTTVSCFCQMLRFREAIWRWERWMDETDAWMIKNSWHWMSSIASTVGWASCNLDGWHTSHHTILTLRARREAEQRAVANLCAEFGREAPQRFVWFVQPWACRKCLESFQEVVLFFIFFPQWSTWEAFLFQKKKPGFSM